MSSSCSPIRQNFRRHLSEKVLSDLSISSENNYFLSIGRVNPWKTEEISDGISGSYASSVPVSNDTDDTETEFWENVVAVKRLTQDNASLVIPRFDWKLGSVYEPYRYDSDLFDPINPVRFYVVVDETRVYKCIDNYYNSVSTVAPTHTDPEIRKLSDGYRWKFMYMIPESKRKFITKTVYDETSSSTAAFQRVVVQGYIPVEYVDYLRLVDEERSLQWNVQQSAIDGEIAFTELRAEYRPYLTAVNCVTPNNANSISQNYSNGYTGSIRIYSPYLIGLNDFYNDLVFSVDSGAGEGQRRVIKTYNYTAIGNYGTITLDEPLTVGLSANSSKFSIVPNIRIEGDGNSRETYLNKFKEADITVKFGPGVTSSRDNCNLTNIYNQTLIDSFEMVDTGAGYSRANFISVKGLTFAAGFTGTGNINDVANIVLSPPGGHGSNAIKELGAAALMVVIDFSQDERKKLSVNNDYRQFGIIKNPLLKKPQTRFRLEQWGLSGSFIGGATLIQGKTGADGATGLSAATARIVSWNDGVSGYNGTSELVVESITSGAFVCGGIVSSSTGAASSGNFTILDINRRTVAGTEGREILRLKISPASGASGAEFRMDGSDFRPGLWVNSIGNRQNNISNSRFTGIINKWETAPGNNALGTLYVEDPTKYPTRFEYLVESDYYMRPTLGGPTGVSATAKVVDIGEITRESVSVYDQTTTLTVVTTEAKPFSTISFPSDFAVRGITGATTQGTGLVVEWSFSPVGATTGTLRLSGVKGTFTGTQIEFKDSASSSANCLVNSVVHEEELLYRSGELIYIQNTQPIKRNIEQREEIKVLFQF